MLQKSDGKPRARLTLSNAPLRLSTGAYILNSGLTLLKEPDRAYDMHKEAAAAYPMLEKLEPKQFLTALGVGEATLGAALLFPKISSRVAGLGLGVFSGALIGMYARNEKFRRSPNDPRPSHEGEPLLKDIWMAGIAASLLVHRRHKK